MSSDEFKEVRVRVPASTANLGPGFDCLGMALGLYHRLTVRETSGTGVVLRADGEGAAEVSKDQSNAVYRAMATVFADRAYTPGHLALYSESEIPLGRGLGSSAAAYIAGLVAAAQLCDCPIEPSWLIKAGLAAEGHADNAAAAVLGGLVVVLATDTTLEWVRMEPPGGIEAVALVPDFSLPTLEARAVLPQQIDFNTAVRNQARVGLLIAALSQGRSDLIQVSMEDELHQLHRRALVPGFNAVRQAGINAGALGVFLSGAGPTLMAFIKPGEGRVGTAMQEAWLAHQVYAKIHYLAVDLTGAYVEHYTKGMLG
jgi:homoserine kinase